MTLGEMLFKLSTGEVNVDDIVKFIKSGQVKSNSLFEEIDTYLISAHRHTVAAIILGLLCKNL